jgi:erythromycin esterase-like protein
LRERFGDELLVVGFDAFSGSFTARGADPSLTPSADIGWTHALPLPLPESVEYTFAQLGLPRFMLDLRSVEENTAAGAWLVEARPMWAIGAAYDPTIVEDPRVVASLVHQFDVLMYFHETSASQLLV